MVGVFSFPPRVVRVSLVLMKKPSFSFSAQPFKLQEEKEEGLFSRGRGQEMTLFHRELLRVRA